MNPLELLMYQISTVFLWPVLLLILLLFVYGFYLLGRFLVEALQRRQRSPEAVCSLHAWQRRHGVYDGDALELEVLRQLEPLRVISRVCPMLGLVATMIPLAPALLALGEGDFGQVGEHLVVAFSAVIVALVTASIVFLILNVRRRWLLTSLHRIEQAAS
ncbi:MotA/TolQ/ExbB proton channel family protein [Wenzhouxiangella sp. AB-CW3]|uniref:MotA/TolQ/ExbB proton channel family protein n=1 Tax=Wenzhouxiangella sp. AB-CW3 TaxID=2771012 RepID=UPI00168A9F3F|nr:MotA/TolQ/ExbB proton channel family protein [Wenzhouxiangella sp. AB-CW3]QOC21470.1 MotA/TolQ/ExbB proton channel family protein [Wenzhouxiangella sp. AB-CW3]